MDLSGSWEYIQKVARNRLANNKTPYHVSVFGEGIEVIGAAGEIVARRELGMPEDLHEGFDNGTDIQFGKTRIDVKTTMLTPLAMHRNLQWPLYKQVKADVILMTVVDPITKQGAVVGYAMKAEILRAKRNMERRFPCYELPYERLHPVYWLIAEKLKVTSDKQALLGLCGV